MKTKLIMAVVVVACLASMVPAKGPGAGNTIPALTEKQAQNIIFLREEEKLARDVYLAMLNLYGSQIFANISTSEQRHMDAVKNLITKYNLTDPVVDDTPGVFANTTLAEIYAQLIDKGSQSLKDAMEVGVMIEEMDIEDIKLMLLNATQNDVINVLTNLLAGSNNHLDAFNKQLAVIVTE